MFGRMAVCACLPVVSSYLGVSDISDMTGASLGLSGKG